MRHVLAGLVVAALAVSPVQAAITYERLTGDDGFKILLLSGEFEADENVSKLETEVSAFEPDVIMFDSPGGITTALEYGRLIRKLEVNTLQLRSHLCASACAFAFVGGYERHAEAGAIGVHQSWFPDDVKTSEAVAGIQEVTADVMVYLMEMGVDTKLLQLSMTTGSDDMRYLTVEEMTELGVITPVREDAEQSAGTQAEEPVDDTQVEAEEPVEEPLPRRRKVPSSTSTDG